MAQVSAGKSPDGVMNNALLPHNSISTRLGCSSQPHLDPHPSFEKVAFTLSPSTPPSRSRASTTSATQQSQRSRSRSKFQSVDLPSREISPPRYRLHSSYEDLRLGRDQESTNEPRYVESYIGVSQHSIRDSDLQMGSITSPLSESGQQLTPLTNTSSRKSEDDKLKKPPALGSSLPSGPKELHSSAPETSNAIQEVYSPRPNNDSGDPASDEDDEIDDEYHENDSETDSIEQRWVSTDEDFEASVLRATENNLDLAARLIPLLYEMFQQEESSVVGFWETCYRQRVGNSYGQGSGTPGGGGDSLHGYTSQNKNDRKRQRKEDEDNGEEENNNQEGNGDPDRGNTKGGSAGGSDSLSFACPFKKKYPEKYNGTVTSSNGKKGEYRTCDAGFDNDNRFKEHLQRHHRFVQCANCSRLFVGDWKKRQIAFQTHHSNRKECGETPPDVDEGVTELQWAQIDGQPRQPRSAAPQKLNVAKWNYVWRVLFPGEEPPHPWHTPNTTKLGQLSSQDVDVAEFKRCYDSAVNVTNEHLSHEETAVRAFAAWWTKRWMEQETQQKLSQMTLQEYTGTKTVYPPREEGQWKQSASFPNTYGSQGRAEMSRYLLHQQPLQSSSTGQPLKGITPPARRNTTDTNPGYKGYGQTPMASQPHPAQWGQDTMYPPGQQATYQPQGVHRTMMNLGIGQPPSTHPDPMDLFVPSMPADCDDFGDLNNNPVDHTQYNYNNSSTPFNMNGVPQLQQTNSTPLLPQPQHLAHEASQPAVYSVRQPQAYGAAGPSGTTDSHPYGNPPIQSQPWTLPVDKLRPNCNYQ